jgi:hypothetical protein
VRTVFNDAKIITARLAAREPVDRGASMRHFVTQVSRLGLGNRLL